MADIETLFTTQVTHNQALQYTEVRFRSVADHTRFLVLTSQGIRLEVPSNGNHIFRSSTWVISPYERDRGRSFYQVNDVSSTCYIAFRADGTQLPIAELCSSPSKPSRLIGINYSVDTY